MSRRRRLANDVHARADGRSSTQRAVTLDFSEFKCARSRCLRGALENHVCIGGRGRYAGKLSRGHWRASRRRPRPRQWRCGSAARAAHARGIETDIVRRSQASTRRAARVSDRDDTGFARLQAAERRSTRRRTTEFRAMMTAAKARATPPHHSFAGDVLCLTQSAVEKRGSAAGGATVANGTVEVCVPAPACVWSPCGARR